MQFTFIGFIVSALVVGGLLILFHHEARRGVRFGETARVRADRWVHRSYQETARIIDYVNRNVVRQSVHYLFHTVLSYTVYGVRLSERLLFKLIHVNKSLARRAIGEREVRTKLDEVTLHKATTALTEDEKRAHKEKALKGD